MASDRDMVSSEDHELNYLLEKWGKSKSKKNREILANFLKQFKKDEGYKPHNRENFYKYVTDKNILNSLTKSTGQSSSGNTANKKTTKKTKTNYNIFLDEVKARAYFNYLKRIQTNSAGDEISDWINAEKEIR